jgi:thermitase
MKTTLLAAVILAALVATPLAAFAAPTRWIPSLRGGEHVAGEVLVKFKPGATDRSRLAAVAMRAHSLIADMQRGWAHVKTRAGESVDEAVATYAADPGVEYAQPNYVYRIAAAPDDADYGQLWAFENTGQAVSSVVQPGGALYYPYWGTAGSDANLEKAWDHITDCAGVVVAVVDTGVNYDHQDLAANMWDGGPSYPNHGYDAWDGDPDPMDRHGHGTHVAGIIGAVGDNAIGTTGVCWTARIMAVRVLDSSGGGTTLSILEGLDFAVAHGAKVINMSLGGGDASDALLSDAIADAANAGVVVVVAAGNGDENGDGVNNDATPTYPCNFPHANLICVAALDQTLQLARFSNYGATSVDVGAPGINILSTWSGTTGNVASPLAAGWTLTSTTPGTGWATVGGNFLVDPWDYPYGLYKANTDDRAYKAFPVADVVTAQLWAAVDVFNGDHFRIRCSGNASDPFAGGGTLLADFTDEVSGGWAYPIGGEVPPACLGASWTLGFQLQSGSLRNWGVEVMDLSITTLSLNATSYNTATGTSMATPIVAGLATMLRAYNPQFTPADVVGAIVQGGRSAPSLAGKTTSGRAVDAMRALAYVNPPTGLTATVH